MPISAAETKSFDLPGDVAEGSLKKFATQSGLEVLFATRTVGRVPTNAVRGDLAPREALDRLLAGTGLVAAQDAATGALTVSTDPNGSRVVAAPAPARPANSQPEYGASAPVTLSPFVVTEESDVGYQAANTTSGSRLNSRLKDTPAAISPITKELISDLAATSIDDLLALTNNEADLGEPGLMQANQNRRSDTSNSFFRMRGQTGGLSVDLAQSGVPLDLADIERVEVSSGPNSVLFGTGNAGGTMTFSTKRANVGRNQSTVKLQLGSWAEQRHEFDFNRRLADGRAAVRVWGLNSDRKGWRHWDFEDSHRLSASLALKPTKATTISGSMTGGLLDRHVTQFANAGDRLTLWRALGAKVLDGAANLARDGTASIGTADRFTWDDQTGLVSNLRGELETRGFLSGANVGLPQERSPYRYSFSGPGSRYESRFNMAIVRVEQRLAEGLNLEVAAQRNRTSAFSTNFLLGNAQLYLAGDPNLTIPTLTGGTTPNSRAGQLFMESNWRPETAQLENRVVRATTAFERDFGRRLGFHRFALLLERSTFDRFRRDGTQIFVDQNNVPISSTTAPETAANQIFRRRYVKEGDFENYYASDPRLPIAPFSIGTRTFTPRVVALSQGNTVNDKRAINSLMFAAQDYWFSRRFITTFGLRTDAVQYGTGRTERLAANAPAVLSGAKLANEWDIVPGEFTPTIQHYFTRTTGAVWHVTKRVSVFANDSDNVGNARFDRTTLSPGTVRGKSPDPTRGQARDGGLMLDLAGDERFFLRLTFYKNNNLGDATYTPVALNAYDNFFTVYMNTMNDYLLARGRITKAEHDPLVAKFSAFTVDEHTKGYELEFVANPLRGWTTRLAFTHSDRSRDNFMAEAYPYLPTTLAFFQSRDDGGVVPNSGSFTIKQLSANLLAQMASVGAAQQYETNGHRPNKGNLTTRYAWSRGPLKGAFFGGNYVYQSPQIMQFDPQPDGSVLLRWGRPVQQTNLFAGYDFRVQLLRARVRLQLNVNNLFNSSRVEPGLLVNDPEAGFRRVYLRAPRLYRFSATLNF